MKRWEYRIETVKDHPDNSISTAVEQLNDFGSEGWEVFHIVSLEGLMPPTVNIFMKRELPEASVNDQYIRRFGN